MNYYYIKVILKKCCENLSSKTDAYIVRIYKNSIKLEYLCKTHTKMLGFYNKTHLYILLEKFENKIDGLLYYGHGHGLSLLGQTSLVDFVKRVIKNIKPRLVCFDACYMADIIMLYEIAPYTRYILASPSWHPYSSIIRTQCFGNFQENNLRRYILNITDEFEKITLDRKEPAYSCCISFDLKSLHTILDKIDILDFTNKEHLYYDKNRFDLQSIIKKKIDKIIIKKPTSCSNKITGIAITNPKSYNKEEFTIYKNTLWYKNIIRKNKVRIINGN